MNELILVTTKDCPLCEKAKEICDKLESKELTLKELDIFSSDDLHINYWDKIPVLIYKDKILNWPFDLQSVKHLISV